MTKTGTLAAVVAVLAVIIYAALVDRRNSERERPRAKPHVQSPRSPWEMVVSDTVVCPTPRTCVDALATYLGEHPMERIASVIPIERQTSAELQVFHSPAGGPWPLARTLDVQMVRCDGGGEWQSYCSTFDVYNLPVMLLPISEGGSTRSILVVYLKPPLTWDEGRGKFDDGAP